jgi:hypothetical protein
MKRAFTVSEARSYKILEASQVSGGAGPWRNPHTCLKSFERALMRVSGVGQEHSELLQAAGVDTIKKLTTRRPENLTAKMEEVHAAKKLALATPTTKAVAGWVEQAKKLDPIISH